MSTPRAAARLRRNCAAILLAASTAQGCVLSTAGGSRQLLSPPNGQTRPWPCRLVVHPPLLALVTAGWERSETFRRQCLQLADHGAVILLDWLTRSDTQTQARAAVGTTSDGHLIARIAVPADSGRILEFVAHEIEHLLERAEGVDWSREAARDGSGVWRTVSGFESQRAIDTGRRVAAEVEDAARRTAKRQPRTGILRTFAERSQMETDRRSFIGAASSLLLSAGDVWSASAGTSAQAAPVSFPGIPNPLEAPVEVIAAGYMWTEGPVWVGGEQGYLLFSDVPGNAIYSWDGKRTAAFLAPSGYQGFPIPATIREAGSNGLALGRGGLLMADSGTRALARVDLATRQKTVFAQSYQGKRFNSPNDLVLARDGAVYFTDPPYGLTDVQKSPLRELTFTGVFRVTPDNQVHLIADNLFPNGIALSPDNRTLYSTDNSGWVAIDLDASGKPTGQRPFVPSERVGGARGDGMKADSAGNLWASGRGGIYVFSPKGEHIGFAPIAGRVSNCAFGPGRSLFVTNDTQVVRGRIRADFPGGAPIQY